MVKDELGRDAVILHTKRYKQGGFLGYNPDGTSINAKNVPAKYVERALEKLSQKKAG